MPDVCICGHSRWSCNAVMNRLRQALSKILKYPMTIPQPETGFRADTEAENFQYYEKGD